MNSKAKSKVGPRPTPHLPGHVERCHYAPALPPAPGCSVPTARSPLGCLARHAVSLAYLSAETALPPLCSARSTRCHMRPRILTFNTLPSHCPMQASISPGTALPFPRGRYHRSPPHSQLETLEISPLLQLLVKTYKSPLWPSVTITRSWPGPLALHQHDQRHGAERPSPSPLGRAGRSPRSLLPNWLHSSTSQGLGFP